MRLLIAAVGRARGAPEETITENYLSRVRALGKKLGFTLTEIQDLIGGRHALAFGSRTNPRQGH